jgi:hypothetical protein
MQQELASKGLPVSEIATVNAGFLKRECVVADHFGGLRQPKRAHQLRQR